MLHEGSSEFVREDQECVWTYFVVGVCASQQKCLQSAMSRFQLSKALGGWIRIEGR